MGGKKGSRIKAALETFAKAIVQPLMYLSVAGCLLIVGIILTNSTVVKALPFLQAAPIQTLGKIIYNSLMFIINNLSVLFCVGIAGAMAKKNKGHASIIALMSYFLFLEANNITLSQADALATPNEMLGLVGTGQTTVLGIQVLDCGVFAGIILGCLTGWLFNRYSGKQFPVAFSMFSGVRFPFLIMILVSWAMGMAFCVIWPPIQYGIASLAGFIKNTGNFGLFIYGMLNKLLVPTGLHHLVYTPFQFSDVGGSINVAGQVISGSYPIYAAEMAMEGQPFTDEVYWGSFTFNNFWPYFGIGLAFIATAYPKNKEKTKATVIPLMITVMLSCITEPFDFLFVFSAPVLFVIHSIISGIMLVLLKVLSIPASTAGGIVNIALLNLVLGIDKTNWPMMVLLGIIDAAIYFFLFRFLIVKFNMHTPGREEEASADAKDAAADSAVMPGETSGNAGVAPDTGEAAILDLIAGLGGKNNIEALENCFTRLRIEVKDPALLDESLIGRVPNSGVNISGTDIQIIYGMRVAEVRDKVENAMEKM